MRSPYSTFCSSQASNRLDGRAVGLAQRSDSNAGITRQHPTATPRRRLGQTPGQLTRRSNSHARMLLSPPGYLLLFVQRSPTHRVLPDILCSLTVFVIFWFGLVWLLCLPPIGLCRIPAAQGLCSEAFGRRC